jgi:hypothetical protein
MTVCKNEWDYLRMLTYIKNPPCYLKILDTLEKHIVRIDEHHIPGRNIMECILNHPKVTISTYGHCRYLGSLRCDDPRDYLTMLEKYDYSIMPCIRSEFLTVRWPEWGWGTNLKIRMATLLQFPWDSRIKELVNINKLSLMTLKFVPEYFKYMPTRIQQTILCFMAISKRLNKRLFGGYLAKEIPPMVIRRFVFDYLTLAK